MTHCFVSVDCEFSMPNNQIDPKLLAVLACPACDDRPPLTANDSGNSLDCQVCRRQYPIQDGIPVLLVDHAIIPETDAED